MSEQENHVEYLIAGIAVMVIPIVLLAFGILIPGFSIDFELHGVPFAYNLSMYFYIALIFAGVAIMACYFRSVRIRPVSCGTWLSAGHVAGQHLVVSIPWSRMVAGALLLAVGVLSFALLGIGFTDRNKIGIWLYLGGPSVSFPTGLIPLIVGAVLVSYALAAVKVVVMHETHGLLTIRELRPFSEIRTSIQTKDIRVAHASNAVSGPRLLWIAFFGFQIFLLLVDGFSFLGNPHAFGTGFLVGGIYVLSACVQIVSLILLLFAGNHTLTIITEEKVYTLTYHDHSRLERVPSARGSSLLERVLGAAFPSAFHGGERELQHPVDLKRLVLGISLLVITIISRAFYFYAGEILWFGFLVLGGILIVQWFKYDFASRGSAVFRAGGDNKSPQCVISRRGLFQDEYFVNPGTGSSTRNRASIDTLPILCPRNLVPPDHLVAIGVALLVGLDISTTLLLAPAGNPLTLGTIILHAGIGIGLLLLAFMSTYDPRRMIGIKIEYWTFQVPSVAVGERGRSWLFRIRETVKAQPRVFIVVIVEILVAFLLGVVLSLILSI